MEKNYLLEKITFLNLKMKKIDYTFPLEKTNKPTKWINIIIHHTKNQKTIQDIINLHVKTNNWSEIGYHFLISKAGTIYYSRQLNTAGAHTFKYNRNSIGIALFGNFDETKPTLKQISSLQKLIKSLQNKYEIKRILGHNQAAFKIIKKKFWKLKLKNLDLKKIQNKNSFKKFLKETTTKILETNSDKKTIDIIEHLTTCPGFFMYQELCKLQK